MVSLAPLLIEMWKAQRTGFRAKYEVCYSQFFFLLFSGSVFAFLQFVHIPQNSASKLMAPKFSSPSADDDDDVVVSGASRVESSRSFIRVDKEWRVPHLSHNCHSRLSFATLDFALSMGQGALSTI